MMVFNVKKKGRGHFFSFHFFVFFSLLFGVLFFGCSSTETASKYPQVLGMHDPETVRFLGEEEQIARYSKPLPYRQYTIEKKYDSGLPSGVLFSKPETPVLDVKVKQPDDYQRLIQWLEEWNSIANDQNLAEEYQKSYLKTAKPSYLTQAKEKQTLTVKRLDGLEQKSWPNSDYSHQAFKKRMEGCQKLSLLTALAHYESLPENKEEIPCPQP